MIMININFDNYLSTSGGVINGNLISETIQVKKSKPILTIINKEIVKGTPPIENSTSQISYKDANENVTGAVINTYFSNGDFKSALICANPSSTDTSELSIRWSNGKACGYAPDPDNTALGSEIATASWVNKKLNNYFPLSGGNLTGNIRFHVNGVSRGFLATNGDDTGMLYGATGAEGNWRASIVLRNDNYTNNPNGVELYTGSSLNGPRLLLTQTGQATWYNKNIVRSVNGINADDNGNVTLNNISGSMPIGSIYFQLSGQSDPTSLFGGTWQNVSSSYAGRFFRAEGGSAAAFGSIQDCAAPNIYGIVDFVDRRTHVTASGAFFSTNSTNGTYSRTSSDGTSEALGISANRSSGYYGAASEIRPVNSTIRIWKRTG